MMHKCTIHTGNATQTLEFLAPARLSAVLQRGEAPFAMPCAGRRQCLKCLVKVSGALSQPDAGERALLTQKQLADGWRYACMAQATGDVDLFLAPQGQAQIQTAGQMPSFAHDPVGKAFGVAIDIGTTTLAAYIYNLQTGALLQVASTANPQSSFGADVMSRISHALQDGTALAQSIREALAALLQALCTAAKVPLPQIDAVVITGNTAMLYLLCDHSPASIAAAPFEQDRYYGEWVSPTALALPLPNAHVYLMRTASAYIGADVAAAALACGLHTPADSPALLVDVGTNGEMVLAAGGRLLCCSTAAGPAFEGAGITCGMPAETGVVTQVDMQGHEMVFRTIENSAPAGFCGSGIVDMVALLLNEHIVDETGAMQQTGHAWEACMVSHDGQPAFRLPQTELLFTQQDIRAVQLAKAAIYAGIQTLLQTASLSAEQVGTLYLAGGFGNHLRVANAQRIGLLPQIDSIRSIGNAAGTGACMALLSRQNLAYAEDLAKAMQTLDLNAQAGFMEQYIESMLFEAL